MKPNKDFGVSELNQLLADDNRRLQKTIDSLLSRFEEPMETASPNEEASKVEAIRDEAMEMIRQVRRNQRRPSRQSPKIS